MPPSSIRVTIDGREVKISRARLGLFLSLERHLTDLRKAINGRNSGLAVQAILSYLQEATDKQIDIGDMPWYEFYSLFTQIRTLNTLSRELPMLKGSGFKRRDPVPWDHAYRPSILWIHLIATAYSWSLTEIENLWPEDGATYVQEILTDEQLRKEWEYMLSSVAHPRDKKGKDLFTPLPRPSWMTSKPKKQRLLRKMQPVGTIINISGIELNDLDD